MTIKDSSKSNGQNPLTELSTEPNSIWETHLPPLQTEDELAEGDVLESLDTLARILQILDIPDATFASYSTAINQLTTEKFTLSRSLNRLRQVEDELKVHLAALKHEFNLIQHWNEKLVPGASNSLYLETTATLERRREALVKKAKEHHRELESLIAEEPLEISITVSQLVAQKEKNQVIEREIKEKRTKLKAFQGLPPNLELARHELRLARQRQNELINLRERLLGKMADGVA